MDLCSSMYVQINHMTRYGRGSGEIRDKRAGGSAVRLRIDLRAGCGELLGQVGINCLAGRSQAT